MLTGMVPGAGLASCPLMVSVSVASPCGLTMLSVMELMASAPARSMCSFGLPQARSMTALAAVTRTGQGASDGVSEAAPRVEVPSGERSDEGTSADDPPQD